MPQPPRAIVGPLRVLLAYLAASAFFFWRLWAPNPADRMMIGTPYSDFLRQFYPYRVFVARSWASGQVPFLNPHQYAGTPAWADPQQGVLYPWRLLQIPLSFAGRTLPLWSVEIEAVAHTGLAAWFTYLLVRRLGASTPAAFLSGLAFGFGGYITGYPLDQLAVLETAAWIPATLWALTAAIDASAAGHSCVRWSLIAAVATSMGALAGHPQTAAYGLAAAAVWLLWRGRTKRVLGTGSVKIAAIWLLVAAGLSAAQWLPTAEVSRHVGQRFDPSDALAGLPPGDVIQLIAPGVISRWSPLFVGVVTLALAAWGAVRLSEARFWVALAGASWLLSLGGNAPLFPALLRLAPSVGVFRHQERLAVLVSLGMAVAAGLALGAILVRLGRSAREAAWTALGLSGVMGLGAALESVRPGALATLTSQLGIQVPADGGSAALADALAFSALMALLAAAVLLLAANGHLESKRLGWALVAITALELFSVNGGQALSPRQTAFTVDPIVSALQPVAREGRVSSEGRLPGGANSASILQLFDTTGDSPIHLANVQGLVDDLPELVWWRLLGVKYVVTDREFELDAPVTEISRSDKNVLYEVGLPAPPAWVVSELRPIPEPWRPEPGFDPFAIGMLPAEEVDLSLETGEPTTVDAQGPESQSSAQLTGMTTTGATVRASLDRPGAVVLSVGHLPGWRASAHREDGTTVRPAIVKAYTALPAVRLPAGNWEIRWTYRPNAVIFGLLASLITLAIGAVLWRRSTRDRVQQ